MPQSSGHVDRLRLFARLDRHDGDVDLLGHEAFGRAEGVRLLHVLVGNYHGAGDFGPGGQEAAELRQVSRTDFNVVAARAEIDADGLRGGGHGRSYVCELQQS